MHWFTLLGPTKDKQGKAEAGSHVSREVSEIPELKSSLLPPRTCIAVAGSWNQEQSQDSTIEILARDVSNPTGSWGINAWAKYLLPNLYIFKDRSKAQTQEETKKIFQKFLESTWYENLCIGLNFCHKINLFHFHETINVTFVKIDKAQIHDINLSYASIIMNDFMKQIWLYKRNLHITRHTHLTKLNHTQVEYLNKY